MFNFLNFMILSDISVAKPHVKTILRQSAFLIPMHIHICIPGRRIYLFGGKSFQKDREVVEVDFYNTKNRKWRTVFNLPGRYSYANIDCVKITIPVHNREFNFNAIQLYNNWIMWWYVVVWTSNCLFSTEVVSFCLSQPLFTVWL